MTAKSLGTTLETIGVFVLIGGVTPFLTSNDADEVSGSSIAVSGCIIIAGGANLASGLVRRRQVWRRHGSDADL